MITKDNVKEVYGYANGKLTRDGVVIDNKPATNGYMYVSYRGKKYLQHRLVWLWHKGKWPSDQIDHIDRDKTNNSIENLRVVCQHENQVNRSAQSNSKSGVLGVSWSAFAKKWAVYYRKQYIGRWSDLESAVAARQQAELADPQHLRTSI